MSGQFATIELSYRKLQWLLLCVRSTFVNQRYQETVLPVDPVSRGKSVRNKVYLQPRRDTQKNSLVQRRVAFAVAEVELRLDRCVCQPWRLHVGLEVDLFCGLELHHQFVSRERLVVKQERPRWDILELDAHLMVSNHVRCVRNWLQFVAA